MDTRQLEMFLVVAEELHFGRAANRLHLSQPSLSQSIKRLERSVGARLLERTTRRVTLTDAGRQFAEAATLLLKDFQQATDAARDAGSGHAGTLRVGFPSLTPDEFLPRLAAAHHARHPRVRIQPELVTSRQQVERIANATLEGGLLWLPLGATRTESENVLCTIISSHQLIVAAPSNHPLSSQRRVPLSSLRNETFVNFTTPAGISVLRDAAIESCQAAGFTQSIVQEAPDARTILSLVGAGVGVAILPDAISSWASPGTVLLELSDDLPEIRFTFARNSSKTSVLVDDLEASVQALKRQILDA